MNDDTRISLSDSKNKVREDLFEIIGVADIPNDEKDALVGKMLDLLEARALEKVVDELSEEKRKELDGLVVGGDSTGVEKFLEENVPDVGEYFEDEAKKLREEIISKFGN